MEQVVAKDPVMQFVAADWLKSNKREDHLANRPSYPVQLFLANQVCYVLTFFKNPGLRLISNYI